MNTQREFHAGQDINDFITHDAMQVINAVIDEERQSEAEIRGRINVFTCVALFILSGVRNSIKRGEYFPSVSEPCETTLFPALEEVRDVESAIRNMALLGLAIMEPALIATLSVTASRLLVSRFRLNSDVSIQAFKNAVIILALGHLVDVIGATHPTFGVISGIFLFACLDAGYKEARSASNDILRRYSGRQD